TGLTACAIGESAKQASTSEIRKPNRKGERLIEFLIGRIVIVFIFFSRLIVNYNPVPRGTRNHSHEALWNSGLTSADSGLQLESGEIALNGVSAKIQPLWLIQPCRR